jgi:hypothetical protein
VTWQEVEETLESGDPDRLIFTSDQVLARVEKHGDLFQPLLELKQKLPKTLEVDPVELHSRSGSWPHSRRQTGA